MAWSRTTWIYPDLLPRGLTHLALPMLCSDPTSRNLRCFATARDSANRSLPVTAQVALDDLGKLHVLNQWEIITTPGSLGAFDEAGLTLSHVHITNSGYACMTFGWRLRKGGGWFNEIGSLSLDFDGRLTERSTVPTMNRRNVDPISMAYPFRTANGSIFYCGPSELDKVTGKPNNFRILQSNEVREKSHHVILDPDKIKIPGIHAFTRPWTAVVAQTNYLWLCMRGEKYSVARIKHAEIKSGLPSLDFVHDFVALENEEEAGHACYPSIFQSNSTLVMLYNGAGYGKSGFGIATQEVSDFS